MSQISRYIPTNLKYSGPAYTFIAFSKKAVETFLQTNTPLYLSKKLIRSWSRTTTGLAEAWYNLSADKPDAYSNGIVVKRNIQLNECIIYVPYFAAKYKNKISSTQYADYVREQEIICINDLTTVDSSMVDGYCIDNKFHKK